MFEFMTGVRQSIEAIDPRLWPVLIALFVSLVYQGVKKVFPAWYAKQNPRLKALPGALVAAVVSGLSSQDIPAFILDVIIGSVVSSGGYDWVQRLLVGSKAEQVKKKQKQGAIAPSEES